MLDSLVQFQGFLRSPADAPDAPIFAAKMGERDSREEIMKAFRLFDDDETVRPFLRLPAARSPAPGHSCPRFLNV